MKFFDVENYKTKHLILLIAIIIIVLPPVLILPAYFKIFNFSGSSSIGETIGGITAPFINGLAAILVFIAFKAQIKANEIITNQEKSKSILSQISVIQEDKINIESAFTYLTNRMEYLESPSMINVINELNKILFFTSEISLALDLIKEYTGDKGFLYKKLYYLYVIRYQALFLNLEKLLKSRLGSIHKEYELLIVELLFQIKSLNENLKDLDRIDKS